jgi:hypothetical protein
MPDPKTRELPNPIEETINWCRHNRPDCVEHLERIYRTNRNKSDESSQAFLLLISLGFAAGRVFQAAPAHDEVPLLSKSPYH